MTIIVTKQRDFNSVIALKVFPEEVVEEEEFHNSSGKDLNL
jgi:hypothetical protein